MLMNFQLPNCRRTAALLFLLPILITLMVVVVINHQWAYTPEIDKQTLVLVGHQKITAQNLYDALLDKYQSPARIDTLSQEEKNAVLQSHIETHLILCEAENLQLDKNPLIQKKVKNFRESALINRLIEKNVVDSILTEARLRSFYDQYGGEIRLRQILISSPLDKNAFKFSEPLAAEDANGLSQVLYQKLQAGEDFVEIARQYSQDLKSAAKGGDLGYVRWGRLPKEVQEAAFALDIGEISKPVKSGFGYHILQLLERKKRSFAQESGTIKYQLAAVYSRTIRNETEKYYFRLAKRYQVKMHRGNFTKLAKATGPFYAPLQTLTDREMQLLLASYAGGQITVADLIEFIGDKAKNFNWHEENIANWTRELVRKAIALEEARRQKVNVEQEVQWFAKKQMVQYLKQKIVDNQVKISDAEMKRYYDSHSQEFMSPEMLHVREILQDDPYLIGVILKALKKGESFAALAEQYSLRKETAGKGGDLGFIAETRYPVIFEAAQKLKINEISEPVQTKDGQVIIQLLGIRPPEKVSFEQARKKIMIILTRQKKEKRYQAWIQSLRNKYPVQIRSTIISNFFAQKMST